MKKMMWHRRRHDIPVSLLCSVFAPASTAEVNEEEEDEEEDEEDRFRLDACLL